MAEAICPCTAVRQRGTASKTGLADFRVHLEYACPYRFVCPIHLDGNDERRVSSLALPLIDLRMACRGVIVRGINRGPCNCSLQGPEGS